MRKNKFNVGDAVYCVRFGTITQVKITKCALGSPTTLLSKEEMNKDLKWKYNLDDNTVASEDELVSTFEEVINCLEKSEGEFIERCKETSLSSFLKGE